MKRGMLIAGLACGIACAATVCAYGISLQHDADEARNEAMARYGGEQVEVLVATRDIYPGETLNTSNVETRTWLSDLLPDECITKLSDVEGQQLVSLVVSGETISSKRFASDSAELEVPENCVALSVPAKDVQAVGGALHVGDLVDVYATGSTTTRIGSNVVVLATNASSSESGNASVSWVTLAVPKDQSQEYVTASQSMEIYFTLPSVKLNAQSASSSSKSDKDSVEGSNGKLPPPAVT